ncbi:dipeptide epimerase [Novosphingobium sp. Gsoil 351]|uniref:dipeptide epimerase n=1 Tax=Novosphingobium sp. Gsoil 351 TaxID=2675225 RepID=UPI0012B4C979|nr:dipeptide epimerase [Novosphingobium sp. Gsoil 351]QGN55637.1 dipeptide epimerase [Novosphingobium sp. Gsoil 351]
MPSFKFTLSCESWRLARPFSISRETIDVVPLLTCALRRDGAVGRGEAVGVDYRGETPEILAAQLRDYLSDRKTLPSRQELLEVLPAGGARNALDCALWDLEAKSAKQRVWQVAGLPAPWPLVTAYTISLAEPEAMAAATALAPNRSMLKLKLGGNDGRDVERVAAVRRSAPERTLVVDVNEGWSLAELNSAAPQLAGLGVALIEQPLPVSREAELKDYSGAVALCVDEGFDDLQSFNELSPSYSCINVKLDKSGGLTAALACADEADRRGLSLFVGCMLGTSLGMAPAYILAQRARYVDLDGPLLLERDRDPGITFTDGAMAPFSHELWG